MAKYTKYSVTDISNIPIANRDINGEYHLRTTNGFKIYRVLNNPSRDFISIEDATTIPEATEADAGLMSPRDKFLSNKLSYDYLFLRFEQVYMNDIVDLPLNLSIESQNDYEHILINTHASQQYFQKSNKSSDIVNIEFSCSIKFDAYQGMPPILGLKIIVDGNTKDVIELPFSYDTTNRKFRFSYTPYFMDLPADSVLEFAITHLDGDIAATTLEHITARLTAQIL